jgi:hypothetical protein
MRAAGRLSNRGNGIAVGVPPGVVQALLLCDNDGVESRLVFRGILTSMPNLMVNERETPWRLGVKVWSNYGPACAKLHWNEREWWCGG